MGVIDIDRRACGGEGDLLHAARRAFQMLQRREHLAGIRAKTNRQTGGDQRIRGLEFAGLRQLDVKNLALIVQCQRLRPATILAAVKMDGLALAADRDQAQARAPWRRR